jgi:isoleucyl-tRNA synthetase
MKKFERVDTTYNFPALDRKALELWRERDVFKRSIARDSPKGRYIFYEGPPTANNNPHIGNMLTRILKDLFPRFRTMQGYHVMRKAGWDCHGLPVEIEIEKRLGLEDKTGIEKLKDTPSESIAYFNELCKKSVVEYTEEWVRQTYRIGFWLDTDDAYFTMTNDYIESVWWILDRMFKRGLLYKGHKILPFCPLCGTSLSSHEVAQNYKETKDPSITVRMRIKPGQSIGGYTTDDTTSFLVWTTTPWTLLSNVAVCVHPEVDYVVIERDDEKSGAEKLVLAEALLGAFALDSCEILHRVKGKELERVRYTPLFDFLSPNGKDCWYATLGDFVTTEDGTGIVHIAPAFGEDDYKIGLAYDLPVICAVRTDGGLVRDIEDRKPEWTGKLIKNFGQGEGADPHIITDLKYRGLLFKSEKYLHQYPYCWRHDTPLIYYAIDSWFFKTTAIKDELVAANKSVEWRPEHVRDGRMGNWLDGVIDWAISRNRYWGTPIPVWINDRTGEMKSFGSYAELFAETGRTAPADFYDVNEFNPHRPFIDDFTWEDSEGGTWRRISEVVDCWFDSGSMPYAQVHFPFEQDKFKITDWWPADFIAEGIDQTRGWFYTLQVLGTFLAHDPEFQRHAATGAIDARDTAVIESKPPAYRVCIANGHVLDEQGRKMSKRLGNAVDLMDVVEKQGGDAVRWYFYQAQPLGPIRLSERAVRESQQAFLIPLYNVYSFFTIYANIDGFDPTEHAVTDSDYSILDRWILGRFNLTLDKVTNLLENYHITDCTQVLTEFVDHLSNWYLRRSRRRYWQSEKNAEKWAAYRTLYQVLVGLSKMLAPFIPFLAEAMYQNLVYGRVAGALDSVHLEDWQRADLSRVIDAELDRDMAFVLDAVYLGRSARAIGKVKIRQPLSKATLISTDASLRERLAPYEEIIAEELNVKEIHWAADSAEFVTKRLKLNFPKAGPRLGKLLPKARAAVEQVADVAAVIAELDARGRAALEIDGAAVEVLADEIEVVVIEQEGSVCQSSDALLVVLDTHVTDELRAEGIRNELINRLQTDRKSRARDYEDRIEWSSPDSVNDFLTQSINKHAEKIASETLTLEWASVDEIDPEDSIVTEIEGMEIAIAMRKAHIWTEADDCLAVLIFRSGTFSRAGIRDWCVRNGVDLGKRGLLLDSLTMRVANVRAIAAKVAGDDRVSGLHHFAPKTEAVWNNAKDLSFDELKRRAGID